MDKMLEHKAKNVVNALLDGKSLNEAVMLKESSEPDDDKVTALLQFLQLDADNEANRERVTVSPYYDTLYDFDGDNEFRICTDEEADEAFHDSFMSLMDDIGLEAFSPSARDYILATFVDEDEINDFYQEDVRSYAEDIQNEDEPVTITVFRSEDSDPNSDDTVDIEVHNRLFNECLEHDMISADDFTADDFDEDGNYIGDMDLVEVYCDHFQTPEDQGYDSGYEWLEFNFGKEWANKFISDNNAIDWDGVEEYIKSEDGRGGELNGWDGVEYEEDVNGITYYIYPNCDFEKFVGDDAPDASDNIDTGEE